MRVYISGPMTGFEELNFPAFNDAQEKLMAAGYIPVNPASNGGGESWEFYMRIALRDLSYCDGIALLPNWQASRGARLEVYIAQQLGMEVEPLEWWLEREL